jgi:hypothetical protein
VGQVSARDGRNTSNVSAWAFGIAIGIHVVALCILASITLARPADYSADTPQAAIGQIKSLSETAAIMPKPKIKEPAMLAKTAGTEKTWKLTALSQEYRTTIENKQSDLTALAARVTGQKPALTATDAQNGRIAFFGNYTYDRKVCFVVDCSGSMKGLFGQVVAQLHQTIDSLEPDQYFYVIFFGGDTLHEYGSGKMVRATAKAKAAAYKFALSIKPSGKTDALRAIKRAMEITDAGGNKPAVIYFLTDGFELSGKESQSFCKYVGRLRQKLAPKTKINTVGFWAQESDRPMLETMANESSGQCVFINKER